VLAELLEQGMRSDLIIPVHKAPAAAQTSNNLRGTAQTSALELESMRSLGINPSHALQHPGFYYYMAAKCTEMRRERFLAATEAEVSHYSHVQCL
jgi:trafficking protein particle complex subunit 11